MMEPYKVSIDSQKSLFSKSIDRRGNDRLIFSAPFGTGKTTFLREFFGSSEKYLAISLYPVNYSVSKNEDIFELIKFDILYELLKHGVLFEKIDVGFVEAIPFLNSEEQSKAIEQFLSLIPKIGKPVTEVLKSIENVFQIITEKRKQLESDEGLVAEEFMKGIENTKGNIYEVDIYTQLITNLLLRLKAESNKQIVLVVDDLDRIDPDHIFRIMNIFAAHVDIDNKNKFGLDKILLSCDIENIRTLFFNKFGLNVDFSGYIDKFYSRDIFEFNNNAEIARSVEQILLSIELQSTNNSYRYLRESSNEDFINIKYFLVSLVLSNAVNLRTLIKMHGRDYTLNLYYIIKDKRQRTNNQLGGLLIFDFMLQFFGDLYSLRKALDRSVFSDQLPEGFNIDSNEVDHFFGDLIVLAGIDDHLLYLGDRGEQAREYQLHLPGISIKYNLHIYDRRLNKYSAQISEKIVLKSDTLKHLVNQALDKYLELDKIPSL